ncbi:UDP-glucose dehydrogenase family protein [Halomonas sp. H5]|uniref:UDP-glucose dehydrogenase family protein n=1 Tax=Halomonas sp. H5 TaxID=3423910 RepID=UPI003D3685C1
MKVTVYGAGYVGLVTAVCLANVGHEVVCVDIDADRVARLRDGIPCLFEPGLEPLLRDGLSSGLLHFTSETRRGSAHGDIQFIAVGTPPDEDGSADLRYVLQVAETIAEHMEAHRIIVNKSTVPVGTADQVRERVAEVLARRGRAELSFDVVSNPEFLKEGHAIADFQGPDRIIIGAGCERSVEAMCELYAPFCRRHEKIMVMDPRSAELTKYAANGLLATKISFINEMANLAERLGADIEAVRQGIGSDPRIGYHFIYPGVGYGGSCFPKDVQALIRTAEGIGFDSKVLKAVEARNTEQKTALLTKIREHFGGELAGRTFALWGLAFKPNTDDMREAPSRVLMEALWEAGARVQAYDPEAMDETQRLYGSRDELTLCGTKEAALKGADALLIVTEWQSFRAPDFDLIKQQLGEPTIFDGRNLYDPGRMAKRGFIYYSIGRRR